MKVHIRNNVAEHIAKSLSAGILIAVIVWILAPNLAPLALFVSVLTLLSIGK